MTSRIQKGGQIFKPNVNPKGNRPVNVPTRRSSTAENRNQESSIGGASVGAFSLNTSSEHLDATQQNFLPAAIHNSIRESPSTESPLVSQQIRVAPDLAEPTQIQVPSNDGDRLNPVFPPQPLFFPGFSAEITLQPDSPNASSLFNENHHSLNLTEAQSNSKQSKSHDSSKKRRKRTDGQDKDAESQKKVRRSSNTRSSDEPGGDHASEAGKSRKSRPSSLPPFDSSADPGEEIDPTIVTMADICKDNGIGRVSSKAAQIESNHAAWKESGRGKRAEAKSIMEAKKYGREESDQSKARGKELPSRIASTPVRGSQAASEVAGGGDASNVFDYSEDLATSRYNVQVRIGPNGETIVDEESLFVDRNEGNEDFDNYTHVEESDQTKFTNSGTYGKKYRGSRWSAVETELFYDALSQFGENYELISYILPGRDRKSCKAKFKAEDKKNRHRIDYCLKNKRPYDIETLQRMTGKDFSGPTPQIRARTPPNLAQTEASTTNDTGSTSNQPLPQSHVNCQEEIIGVVEGE